MARSKFNFSDKYTRQIILQSRTYYEIFEKVHAFVLPNKSHLSYAFIYDLREKGSQFKWTRTFFSRQLMKFNPKQKERQTRLGLWTSRSNQHVICADFDRLPDGFADFKSLQVYMKSVYGDRSLTIKSKSGKVKSLFVVDLGEEKIMTKDIALDSLQKILEPEIFDAVDKTYSGLSIMFIRPRMVLKISDWLKNAYVFDAIIEEKEPHFYTYHDGDIPEFFDEFIAKDIRGHQERIGFVRMLLNMHSLLVEFGLPTTKISRELGVNQKTASRWRTQLVELGLLELENENYQIKKKSKTFKACGELEKYLMEKYNGKKKYLLPISDEDFPESIDSGNWHETAWELSGKFINKPERFIELAKRVPGVNRKNRLDKFVSAVNNRRKYNFLPEISS